jgi:hypothetical protein
MFLIQPFLQNPFFPLPIIFLPQVLGMSPVEVLGKYSKLPFAFFA